ncbi:MAG: hypothetical protein P8L44_01045 [Opitutales bacterium]|jgi:hypothetical protein|nr:hypothetical protein [Opitutales bacterium]
MNRIPLSLLVGITLICLPFFQLGAADTVLDWKFNGSSEKSAEKSVETIKSELSETEFKVFSKAYGSIALKWAEDNKGESGDEPDWFGLMRRLDGMRVSEIINMAAREDLSFTGSSYEANTGRDTSTAVEAASGATEAELN